MNLFTIENLSLDEIVALRQSLNVIDIKGSSAQFVANLQQKLDQEITEIQTLLHQDQNQKQEGIKNIEKSTKQKSTKQKS